MELEEFIEKAKMRKIAAGIYAGNFGFYKLSCWSEDWEDKGRETPEGDLSRIPPEGGCFVLPSKGRVETYKLREDTRAVEYVSIRKIPEESIKKLRRQLEDCLRKSDLETILTAATATGMSTGRFVLCPIMF